MPTVKEIASIVLGEKAEWQIQIVAYRYRVSQKQRSHAAVTTHRKNCSLL
jgi:hypothetical protein